MRRCLIVLLGVLGGCSSPPAVESALHGDLATLKRHISQGQQDGHFNRRAVWDLARAVASREVYSARGDEGEELLGELSSCARPLANVLRARAKQRDCVGARATLLLLEAGEIEPGELVSAYGGDEDASYRALAARDSTSRDHRAARRAFFVDPDERVRRAALAAAALAADPGDAPALLEVARLDPEPSCRRGAVHALGGIGTLHAVSGLRDATERADQRLRVSVLGAYATPRAYGAGGKEELLRVARHESGLLRVVAAASLLVSRSDEGRALALAVLERAVREGTLTERRLAIRFAPVEERAIRKALFESLNDGDRSVRIAVLKRLLATGTDVKESRLALSKLALGGDAVALEARVALAESGDASVAPALRAGLDARSSRARQSAALALLRLGDYESAATALGDDDPSVRVAVACAVLTRR
jgi:HEAT repeat protein